MNFQEKYWSYLFPLFLVCFSASAAEVHNNSFIKCASFDTPSLSVDSKNINLRSDALHKRLAERAAIYRSALTGKFSQGNIGTCVVDFVFNNGLVIRKSVKTQRGGLFFHSGNPDGNIDTFFRIQSLNGIVEKQPKGQDQQTLITSGIYTDSELQIAANFLLPMHYFNLIDEVASWYAEKVASEGTTLAEQKIAKIRNVVQKHGFLINPNYFQLRQFRILSEALYDIFERLDDAITNQPDKIASILEELKSFTWSDATFKEKLSVYLKGKRPSIIEQALSIVRKNKNVQKTNQKLVEEWRQNKQSSPLLRQLQEAFQTLFEEQRKKFLQKSLNQNLMVKEFLDIEQQFLQESTTEAFDFLGQEKGEEDFLNNLLGCIQNPQKGQNLSRSINIQAMAKNLRYIIVNIYTELDPCGKCQALWERIANVMNRQAYLDTCTEIENISQVFIPSIRKSIESHAFKFIVQVSSTRELGKEKGRYLIQGKDCPSACRWKLVQHDLDGERFYATKCL